MRVLGIILGNLEYNNALNIPNMFEGKENTEV